MKLVYQAMRNSSDLLHWQGQNVLHKREAKDLGHASCIDISADLHTSLNLARVELDNVCSLRTRFRFCSRSSCTGPDPVGGTKSVINKGCKIKCTKDKDTREGGMHYDQISCNKMR